MAEEDPESALDRCVKEVRDGAHQLPKLEPGDDWDISDALIGDGSVGHYREFLVNFSNRFLEYGKGRWRNDRDRAIRMGRYIGIMARFFAEADKRDRITVKDLDDAIAFVSGHCKLLRKGTPAIREIWCP